MSTTTTTRGAGRTAGRLGKIHGEKKRKRVTKTTRRRKKAREDVVREDTVL
jgi:hypothetical protein